MKNEELRMKNMKNGKKYSSFFIHNSSFISPLSTHCARHTWATRAKQELVPLSQISEALGHRSEKTTSIYLASFGHTVWQEINHKIRDSIKKINKSCV